MTLESELQAKGSLRAVKAKMSFIVELFEKYEYKNGSIVDKVSVDVVGWLYLLFLFHQVPTEMLHLIDTYWYAFPPINPLWQIILGTTITILAM